jgi:hypothetical protein
MAGEKRVLSPPVDANEPSTLSRYADLPMGTHDQEFPGQAALI